MAERPVFISEENKENLFKVENIKFEWFPGFSASQKKKSVQSLHENILKLHPDAKVLEVSSKSENELGIKLSAFNLMISTKKNISFSVEVAFQASKVFKNGGPYIDLYHKGSKEAKKDVRLKNSGPLTKFSYFGRDFPLEPKTLFYNWLYINSLNLDSELNKQVLDYKYFTDIEFNPQKSINCQAEAVSIYVSLCKNDLLKKALNSVENFEEIVYPSLKETTKKDIEQIEQLKLL